MHIQDKDATTHNRIRQSNLRGHKGIKQSVNKAAKIKRERRKQTIRCMVYLALIGFCCFCIWRMEAGRNRSHEEPNPSRQIFLTDWESGEGRGQDSDIDPLL